MKSLFLTAAEGTATLSDWLSALTRLNLTTILSAIVIFVVGYALIKWVAKLADKLLSRNNKLDPSIRSIAVNAGRILLRESGTEPLIRVMVEAADKQTCQECVDSVIDIICKQGHVKV